VCLSISVFHSNTKVNNNYLVIEDAEVLGLDIFMDEALIMKLLNSIEHLHKDIFEAQLILYILV